MLEQPGHKDDAGKLRWDLLPRSLETLVELYTRGALKYDDWNWAKGLKWTRVYAAMMRHLARFWFYNERYDPETGCHHLAAVAWGALTLLEYDQEALGEDDRHYAGH